MYQNPTFRIHFRLTPLVQVLPSEIQGVPHLYWHVLSDGQYWFTVGNDELFRYSDATMVSNPGQSPYVDYDVFQLLRDLLDILPAILEPVPADLAVLIATPDVERAWLAAADARLDEQPDEPEAQAKQAVNVWYSALSWWQVDRRVRTDYLGAGWPNIHLWRSGDSIRVRWDNRNRLVDGMPVWSAQVGELALSVDAFQAELTRFHAHLMDQMRERVGELIAYGPSGLPIDGDAFHAAQQRGEGLLSDAFHKTANRTAWGAVRQAVVDLAHLAR